MAYFALLWKARTIEKYRRNYESEKIKSIMQSNTQLPKQSLSQRWKHYRYDTQKRISRIFRKWYPEGSTLSNLLIYLKTDQTFPNFVLKSVLGFFGGIILTYLCFMFFVFQLSISLIHATIMSSIIGVLLTLGLAFSYRIRCLVFLLIPQFFSRVGRYTLTCYALVLILTGPATNTLKNSEVLSESLACGQEQIKTNVNQIHSLMTKSLNSLKDSIKLMIDRLRLVAIKMKQLTLKIKRLVLNIAQVIESSFLWLNSLSSLCTKKFGTSHPELFKIAKRKRSKLDNMANLNLRELFQDISLGSREKSAKFLRSLKPNVLCVFMEHLNADIVPIIKKRLRNYSDRIANMFSMRVHVHHSYSFSSNDSRSASQVAAGIVTEIRKRADPLLTWLSWSSCVTSLFLLLIIFRAKYYQHMFDTRSRFDNRYITKEIRSLDLKRLREGRETILPLNRRERAKYVTTTSFRLVASEKAYLNRSVVFMSITTFKLLIHMVADYSLYWVLMTIRYHGRLQTIIHPGSHTSGPHISGSGPTADLLKSILASLGVLLEFPASTPVSCLPNPFPPDFKRYTQIGVLIFLLWFFAMFEPYGLRLRHVIMGHYQPERAKARADWLYNHILRTRGHLAYDLCLGQVLKNHTVCCAEPPTTRPSLTLNLSDVERQTVLACIAQAALLISASCARFVCLQRIMEIIATLAMKKDPRMKVTMTMTKPFRVLQVKTKVLACETRSTYDSYSSNAVEKYKRGMFSKIDKNLDQDTMPLLPKSNDITEYYVMENNKSIIKKALLVRHIRHNMDQRFHEYEKKHLIYCDNCDGKNNPWELKNLYKRLDKCVSKDRNIIQDISSKAFNISGRQNPRSRNSQANSIMKKIITNNSRHNFYYKKPKHLKTQILSIVPKSSIYSISLKGSKVKVQKITNHANIEDTSKKNSHKESSGDAKRKPNKSMNKKNKKKSKSDKKKDVNANKEAEGNITVRSTESTCRCFKHFRILFCGLFRDSKTSKRLNDVVTNTKFSSKDKINHKRRKKKKPKNSKSENINIESEEIVNKDDTRKYRISAYLADQDWIKRQCMKNDNKVYRKTDISEAVAVINSTSKNKLVKKRHREEIYLNLEPVIHKSIGSYHRDDQFKTSLDNKNMTFSDLWKRIGFKLLSDSSSSSFMENVFRRTREIFLKEVKYSSSDIARRLQFYESLGNEDFKNFKDNISCEIESNHVNQKQNNIESSVKAYPDQEPDNILDCSPCSTCTDDYRIHFDKYQRSSSHSDDKKKSIEIKRVVSCIRFGYESAMSYIKSLLSNRREETKKDADTQSIREPGKDFGCACTDLGQLSKTEDTPPETKPKPTKDDGNTERSCACIDTSKLPTITTSNNVYSDHLPAATNKDVSNASNPPAESTSCPCPDLKQTQAIEKCFDNPAPKTSKGTCAVLKQLQTADKSCDCDNPPQKTCMMRDMKTGSSTSDTIGRKCWEAVPSSSILKLTKNDYWIIADNDTSSIKEDLKKIVKKSIENLKSENYNWAFADRGRSSTKEHIKKIVKKSIRKLKSASQGLQNAISKSITKLTGTPSSEKEADENTRLVSGKRPVKNTDKARKSFVEKSSLTVQGPGDAVEVPDEANKTIAERHSSNAKGTQFNCACKSALDLLNQLQLMRQSIRTSKEQANDTKSKTSKAEKVKQTPEIEESGQEHSNKNEQETPTETESSEPSEEQPPPKFITPTKRSGTSVRSRTSQISVHSNRSKVIEQSVDKTDSWCACNCVCSDAEDSKAAKETCTCATQYVPIDKDKNVQREIFEYSSGSCSSSDSSQCDPSVTDCTICSLVYVNDKPRRRKGKVNVVTKANQATGTDKPRMCDVGTLAKDWWSPILEKKRGKQIKFDRNVREIPVKNERDFIGDHRRQRNAVKSEGRIVTFRSQAQIIPTGREDIMSPSRYLLESQWYYNELFSSKLYAPHLFPVNLIQKPINGSRTRSPTRIHHHTRRNHKTKRLEECYSPRKQITSPRRRSAGFEWIRTNEDGDGYQRKRLLRSSTKSNNMKKFKNTQQ